MLQRLDDAELLPHAARVLAHRAVEVLGGELEQLARTRAPAPLATAQERQVLEHLESAHALVEPWSARQVAEAAALPDAVEPRVAPEHRDRSLVGAQESERDADGGRLAGAVRAEEAEHLALRDPQVEAVERRALAIALDDAGELEGHVRHARTVPSRVGRPRARRREARIRAPVLIVATCSCW